MSHDDAPLVADHGSKKQLEPTDPLEPMASVVPGDADYLARCFVEEFAFMGYDGEAIFELFRDPRYLAVHAIWERRGEEEVRGLIDEVLAECGVMHVNVETPRAPRRPRKVAQIEVPGDDAGASDAESAGSAAPDGGRETTGDGFESAGHGREESGR